jgi:DNA-binding IclR family transcriptional regulator
MGNEPAATMTSVDNALRVLELLATQRSLRVSEVADHLQVARSTAHRLLAALLARGYVVQDAHKVYRAGPTIDRFRENRLTGPRVTRELLHPHLERLAEAVGETCHIAVLEGNGTRFVDSVESGHVLRVGSRVGMLLPAHKTAIGLVLLAEMSLPTLRAIYPRGLTGDAREAKQTLQILERKIRSVRKHGYATNLGESDAGISAIGLCLRDPHGRAFAGIAVAIPTPRFDRYTPTAIVAHLQHAAKAIQSDLEESERAEALLSRPSPTSPPVVA